MMEQLKLIDKQSWILIGIFILMGLIIFIKRESKIVKRIVFDVIVDAEQKFNSKEGQLKLDYAVQQLKMKVPYILRVFVTKYLLVTVIEYVLNKFSHLMKVDKQVDILGNDDSEKISQDYKFEKGELGAKYTYENHKKIVEPDSYIYGEIEGRTDFKGNDSAVAKIGIKKKL